MFKLAYRLGVEMALEEAGIKEAGILSSLKDMKSVGKLLERPGVANFLKKRPVAAATEWMKAHPLATMSVGGGVLGGTAGGIAGGTSGLVRGALMGAGMGAGAAHSPFASVLGGAGGYGLGSVLT